jgi:hypothetical protein
MLGFVGAVAENRIFSSRPITRSQQTSFTRLLSISRRQHPPIHRAKKLSGLQWMVFAESRAWHPVAALGFSAGDAGEVQAACLIGHVTARGSDKQPQNTKRRPLTVVALSPVMHWHLRNAG